MRIPVQDAACDSVLQKKYQEPRGQNVYMITFAQKSFVLWAE